ncbi:hypothetical protein PRDsepia_22 [Enterobacteria phage PRDsepia]
MKYMFILLIALIAVLLWLHRDKCILCKWAKSLLNQGG